MKYIVIEIQVNTDGTVGTLVTQFDNRNQAESTYHSILASAAISALPKHSAVILTDTGDIVASGCYVHRED